MQKVPSLELLKEYQLFMRQACRYGSLTREVHQASIWLKQTTVRLDRIIAKLAANHCNFPRSARHLQEVYTEACSHRSCVDGLIHQGWRHLQDDPDTLLFLDVANLAHNWQTLKEKLRKLDPKNRPPTYETLLSENKTVEESVADQLVSLSIESLSQEDLLYQGDIQHSARIDLKDKQLKFLQNKVRKNLEKEIATFRLQGRTSNEPVILVDEERCHPQSPPNHDLDDDQDMMSNNIDIGTSKMNGVKKEGSPLGGATSSRSSPIPVRPSNLRVMKNAFPSSSGNLSFEDLTDRRSTSSSPLPGRLRSSPSERDQSPIMSKRRRMNTDTPSSVGSPRDSPTFNMSELGSDSFDDFGSRTFEDFSDSQLSSPGADSPSTFRTRKDFRGRYRKDELWAAIESDYQYLMDEEIIETCKSTESDLSWESDDHRGGNTKLSFTEFVQQYKELTDWLTHIQVVTQRQSSSLSEKYLNQTYHEEMLQRSPRRKLFNDYAKQLMRRYPSMRDEIQIRIQHLNNKWEELEQTITPSHRYQDEATMLKDLEQDLNGLRKWLHEVEGRLLPLSIKPNWAVNQLEAKLKEHQSLQRDIESHSKIVSAVVKLCEHLQTDKRACTSEGEADALQLVAINLEQRWHGIWLQSLEWQCRLEDAISKGKGLGSERNSDWGSFHFTSNRPTSVHLTARQDADYSDLTDYESDNSNLDVIPFSENEYEKITVDTDCQTEAVEDGTITRCSSSSLAASSGKEEGCDDTGIDSALGRSVSDQSIGDKPPQVYHCNIQLSTDRIDKVVSKAVTFAAQLSSEMKALPNTSMSPAHGKRATLKSEFPDVGYSSESHSNDENMTESTETDGSHTKQNLTLDGVVLRRKNADGSSDGAEQTPSPSSGEKSWRHSMTSAYDTSSNCSDLNSPLDLHDELDLTLEMSADTTATTVEQVDIFYTLTPGLDTDSESIAARSGAEMLSGTPTDVDSEFSKSLELADDFHAHMEKLTHSTPVKPDDTKTQEDIKLVKSSHLNVRRELIGGSHAQEANIVQSETLLENDGKSKDRSDSLTVQVDQVEIDKHHAEDILNDNVVATQTSFHDNVAATQTSLSEHGVATQTTDNLTQPDLEPKRVLKGSSESIKRLIKQADLMVRDKDILNMQAANLGSKRKKLKGKHRLKADMSSVTSTDVSALPAEEVSSCDASGESTSEEEDSEEERYSTASSDHEGNVYTSLTLTNRSVCSSVGRSTRSEINMAQAEHKNKVKLKGRHRPWSVTELYELTNRLDLSPFSISESAIDELSKKQQLNLPGGSKQKLRRAISDTSSLSQKRYDSPRKRRRKLRRSTSDETEKSQSGVSRRTFRCAPYQSSQEWRTQSLSSGDKTCTPSGSDACHLAWGEQYYSSKEESPCPEIPRSGLGSESESETAGAAVRGVFESDDTDAMLKSMNSTMESFSENAWDNYQDPPYPSVSDDPTEEKLDGTLHWDQSLEFEEDFHLDSTFGSGIRIPRSAQKVKERRSQSGLDGSRVDDSDSDIEDLHHVIEESTQQFRVTESSLRKHRKDVMDTGIYLDPSKYSELLATCQTNIKCLSVIGDTLDSDGLANVIQDDIEQVHDLVGQWEELEEVAHQRQVQSRELSAMYRELQTLTSALQEVAGELSVAAFDDVNELEHNIKYLQEHNLELNLQRARIASLSERASTFSRHNPSVKMAAFSEEINKKQKMLTHLADVCSLRVSELQSVVFSWYDFNETHKELAYLLSQERHNLHSLDVATVTPTTGSEALLASTIHDLKTMQCDFDFYESKLASLRQLSGDILGLCTDRTQMELRASVARVDAELGTIERRCATQLAQLGASTASQTRLDKAIVPDAEEAVARRPLLLRLLKAAIPLQIALVLLFGLAYILDPTMTGEFHNFGLVFSPQLRYVRGPPPT